MRKDVKAGLVLALGVVIVAGWYYSGKKGTEPTVPLAKRGANASSDQKPATSKAKSTDRKGRHASKSTDKTSGNKRRSNRKPATSKEPRSNQDRLASSNKGNSSQKPSSKTNTKNDPTTKPLKDIGEAMTGFIKPNDQAGPPSDMKKTDDASGKKPLASKTGANERDKAKTGSTDPKDKFASGKRDTPERGGPKGNAKPNTSTQTAKKDNADRPNMEGSERYTIQPGDSFNLLAEVYYGSQSYAGFLMRANPHVSDPKRLRVGTEIFIPELPKKEALRARTSAGLRVSGRQTGRTYIVAPGDSLTGIAEKQLGATARWKELYELNKDVIKNPDVLRAGVVLVLPKT